MWRKQLPFCLLNMSKLRILHLYINSTQNKPCKSYEVKCHRCGDFSGTQIIAHLTNVWNSHKVIGLGEGSGEGETATEINNLCILTRSIG